MDCAELKQRHQHGPRRHLEAYADSHGPAFYDYDFAFIKDTPLGQRQSGIELFDLQFRAEFFNLFNIVDMGLPANTIKDSGFGLISKTAGNSRQIQFSLKLIY